MKKKQLIANILVALALSTGTVSASDVPSYDLEEIVVTANAERPAMATDTVNVKVVSPGKAASIPELLRQTSGLDIQMRTKEGDSQDGTVKLRGYDARRFAVLVDGRPVNMSGVMGGSYVDWTTIPLDMVEKIQIIKGAKAAAYGNTLGGVINIITKTPSEPTGSARVGFAENGHQEYLFNYGASQDKVYWFVNYNKMRDDAFLRNNDFDSEQYGLKLGYAITKSDKIDFNVAKVESKRGFIMENKPGNANYDPSYPISDGDILAAFSGSNNSNAIPQPGSYWEKTLNTYDVAWTHKIQDGSIKVSYWNNDEKRHEVNYTATGALLMDRTVVSDKSDGWALSGDKHEGKHTYNFGGDYKQLRYGYGSYVQGYQPAGASSLYPSQKVDLAGLYLDDTWSFDNRWTANMGLRWDQMTGGKDDASATTMKDVNYSALSPKFNLSFKNNDKTTTFVSVNRLWRAPSMAEFYWWSQPFPAGKLGTNTLLKPEKGWGYELGVHNQVSNKWSTKITAFYQDIQDYINFTHLFPYSCYNIDNANIWGFEWENTYKLTDKSQLLLNYTNQHTKKDGVSSSDLLGLAGELDYRPAHKVAIGYQYDAKPWQARYTINYTGRQSANYPYGSSSTVTLGGYTVHNLAISRDIGKGTTLNVAIDNLLDKNYQEQYNYPMPGRVFGMSITQKF